MPSEPVIRRIQVSKVLSFGAEFQGVDLGQLNVLIGPNGSGKSNFIEIVGLLHHAPTDLAEPIRESGGIRNWMWKGDAEDREIAAIAVDIAFGEFSGFDAMRYELQYLGDSRFAIIGENFLVAPPGQQTLIPLVSRAGREYVTVTAKRAKTGRNQEKSYKKLDLDGSLSVLAQPAEAHIPRDLYKLIEFFKAIRLYRNWRMGRDAPARFPQPADLRNDFLEENGRNLGHVLNQFRSNAKLKNALIENLQRFLEDARDIDVLVQGGTLQLYLHERSFEDAIPAMRMSDGTLRWLSLLAILLHPSPPPVVCLEEPEVGLHPDMMHVLAELLRDASERMQLIVTTHSEALVDALSSTPESVIVCEKEDGVTRMRRLDREKLAIWLEEYSLGHLWRSGQIGGNRW